MCDLGFRTFTACWRANALALIVLLSMVRVGDASSYRTASSVELEIQIGGLTHALRFPAQGEARLSVVNFPLIVVEESLWEDLPRVAGTSLFTGIPLISNLTLSPRNAPGSFGREVVSLPNPVGPGMLAPGMRGNLPLGSAGYLDVLGAQLGFGLQFAGAGGSGPLVVDPPIPPSLNVSLAATGGLFQTGEIQITGISSLSISLPERPGSPRGVAVTLRPTPAEVIRTLTVSGGIISDPGDPLRIVHVATLAGSNRLATSGAIAFVAPMRIQLQDLLGSPGAVAGVARLTFQFAPEPGRALLLAAGIIWLLALGRHRMPR